MSQYAVTDVSNPIIFDVVKDMLFVKDTVSANFLLSISKKGRPSWTPVI